MGRHGSPGTLCVKFYNLVTEGNPQTLILDYNLDKYDFNLASSDVDLKSGSILIDPKCDDVAENIALAFSVALLHVLCVPRPNGWTEGKPVKPPPLKRGHREVRGIPSDDLTLILAAGLLISTPSNYFFHTLHGHDMCALCGGNVVSFEIDDLRLPSSTYGYGHHGTGCASTCSVDGRGGGCGGCHGACGGCQVGGCGGKYDGGESCHEGGGSDVKADGCCSGFGGDNGGCGGGCGGCGGGCGGCG